MRRNVWLIAGGMLSAVAALLHIAIIAGGPDWYRFFGAGEAMAQAAERGATAPALITVAIAAVLGTWAAFAWSGAGLIRRLPLLRTALVTITAIYCLRGLAPLPIILIRPGVLTAFDYWSSAIVLVYGLVHAIGTVRAWPHLKRSVGD